MRPDMNCEVRRMILVDESGVYMIEDADSAETMIWNIRAVRQTSDGNDAEDWSGRVKWLAFVQLLIQLIVTVGRN